MSEPLTLSQDNVAKPTSYRVEAVTHSKFDHYEKLDSIEYARDLAKKASKACHEARVYVNNVLVEVYRQGKKS